MEGLTGDEIRQKIEEISKQSAELYQQRVALEQELARRDAQGRGEVLSLALVHPNFEVSVGGHLFLSIRVPDGDWIQEDLEAQNLVAKVDRALQDRAVPSSRSMCEVTLFGHEFTVTFERPFVRIEPSRRAMTADEKTTAWRALLEGTSSRLEGDWSSRYLFEKLDELLPIAREIVHRTPKES
jgi:hypothetical protein